MRILSRRAHIKGKILLTFSLIAITQGYHSKDSSEASSNVSFIVVSANPENTSGAIDNYGKDAGLGEILQLPCHSSLYKCCKESETMVYHNLECSVADNYVPPFQPVLRLDQRGSTIARPLNQLPLKKAKFCRSFRSVPEYYFSEPSYHLNLNNRTITALLENGSSLNHRDFCLDYVSEVKKYIPFLCSKIFPSCYRIWIGIHLAGHYISILSLVISFIIYIIFPDLRRLHGKSMVCLMISLLFTYITNAVTLEMQDDLFESTECATLGMIIYFLILSSVFWFSVICIEMNRNFRNLRNNILVDECILRVWHVLYAVLCPAVLTITVRLLTLPQFWERCWFTVSEDELYFYNTPIITITIINLTLFTLTAFDIHMIKRELAKVICDGRKKEMDERQQQKYRLFVKLWIMMGLPLTIITIGELFGCSKCYCLAISTPDMYQGLYFFIVFFWNDKVKKHLKNLAVKYLPSMNKSSNHMNMSAIDSSTHSTDVTGQNRANENLYQ